MHTCCAVIPGAKESAAASRQAAIGPHMDTAVVVAPRVVCLKLQLIYRASVTDL